MGERVDEPRFVEDLQPSGVLHVAFVRSNIAHAAIEEIDVDGVRDIDAVRGVWTALDLPEAVRVQNLEHPTPGLAVDVVRFVGEPVAVVVADELYAAADAAGMAFLDLDPLPTSATPLAALEVDASLVHERLGSNAFLDEGTYNTELLGAHQVTFDVTVPRTVAMTMTSRGCVTSLTDAGLRMWASCRDVQGLRRAIAQMLGMDEGDVSVTEMPAGRAVPVIDGWGVEELVVAYLTHELGAPMKYVETRTENMQSAPHNLGLSARICVACDAKAIITGLSVDALVDLGAYPQPSALEFARSIPGLLQGPYAFGSTGARVRGILTHTTPTVASAGGGRVEAAFLRERALDVLAAEAGVDPGELRQRNLVDDVPRKLLERLLDRIDYTATIESQVDAPPGDDTLATAIGLSLHNGTGDRIEAHACLVGVERATGEVTVLRYAVEPGGAFGHADVGVARGVAEALYEGVQFDQDGNPLTGNLLNYLAPTAADLPRVEGSLAGQATSLLGLRAPQTVVNGVARAVGRAADRRLQPPLDPANVLNVLAGR